MPSCSARACRSPRSIDDSRMLMRLSLLPVARAVAFRRASSALVATGVSWPFSKASSSSSSCGSSLVIACVLVQIVARGFAAWDDRFKKIVRSLFDKRNQVCITVKGDDHHTLPGIFCWPWVAYHIKQAAVFYCHCHAFKRHAALGLELVVFIGTPSEWLHQAMLRGVCLMYSGMDQTSILTKMSSGRHLADSGFSINYALVSAACPGAWL